MITINGTTQSLQAVMNAAATTTNPTFTLTYVDVNLTSLVQANTATGSLNGTTPVTLLSGTTDQLSIKSLTIFNNDTVQQIITVSKNVSSSLFGMYKYALNPGDSLHFDEGRGWYTSAYNIPASIFGNQFLTSGTTYTTPSNISATTQFKFTLIGAGGGGGGINTAADSGTGGGGGGACVVFLTGLAASTAYTIAIGAGGAGGIAVTTPATAGGNTTLTVGATTYTAGGGGAGADTIGGGGGAGGVATNGTINITGMSGRNGGATTTAAGDGGNAALGFGAGGSGLEAAGTGNAGMLYGGGGGAGRGATATGGAGANGCILVEYTN
jgi:hypothetical protein